MAPLGLVGKIAENKEVTKLCRALICRAPQSLGFRESEIGTHSHGPEVFGKSLRGDEDEAFATAEFDRLKYQVFAPIYERQGRIVFGSP